MANEQAEVILNVLPNQEKQIQRAFKNKRGTTIKLKKPLNEKVGEFNPQSDGPSRGKFYLTALQNKQWREAEPESVLKMKFTNENLREQPSGGFLPMILGLIGASIASGLVERAVAGGEIEAVDIWDSKKSKSAPREKGKKKNLIWNRGDSVFHVKPSGRGFHLSPYRGRGNFTFGSGLYLRPWRRGGAMLAKKEDLKNMSKYDKKLLKSIVKK